MKRVEEIKQKRQAKFIMNRYKCFKISLFLPNFRLSETIKVV